LLSIEVDNKRKNILVWVLTWAGLLLAVLYSPIGSPDLYKSGNNFSGNQNVNFASGNIENAPNVNFESNNDYQGLNVPDYNSETSSKLSSGNYSYSAKIDEGSSLSNSYSVSQSPAYGNQKSSSSGNANIGGVFISNNNSRRSDGSSAIAMSNGGITTLSTDLTATSTKQGVSYAANHGGTDPGGDPDPKTRIPVSDGWVFLLALAASYGFLKKKFF